MSGTNLRTPIPRDIPVEVAAFAHDNPRATDPATQEREFAAMDLDFDPSNLLPSPPEHPDFVYRWCSVAIHGEANQTNIVQRRREGWRPVMKTELPEFAASLGNDGLGHEEIRVVSQVLHRMPRDRAAKLKAYYSGRNGATASESKFQVSASDAAMGNISDESKISVTRGRTIAFGDGR